MRICFLEYLYWERLVVKRKEGGGEAYDVGFMGG